MIQSTPASAELRASAGAEQKAHRSARAITLCGLGVALSSCGLAVCAFGIGGVSRWQWRDLARRDETAPVVGGPGPVAQSREHRDG